ncbi:unnamed protein product [Echinostoma caproni]|uniref:Uncharacterized protein n=1 Tax=Echinostoma caproni TaxID=27848 RepID=A0A3P8HU29_9TREM|nr:unnamed protein product [Echinostoma caproni]
MVSSQPKIIALLPHFRLTGFLASKRRKRVPKRILQIKLYPKLLEVISSFILILFH